MNAPRARRLLTAALLLLLAGCAGAPSGGARRAGLSPQEEAEASRRYEQLKSLAATDQAAPAQALAYEILDRYPGFSREDHVLLLGARASETMGDERAALVLLEELTRRYPRSPYRAEAWWDLARLQDRRRDYADAAESYVLFFEASDPGDARRETARDRLRTLLDEELRLDELESLRDAYGDTVVGSYVSWEVIQRRREADDPATVLGPLVEDFLRRYPQSRYRPDAEALLARLQSEGAYRADPGLRVAFFDRVGLLAPLTGEYAALGQAMYNGALLALEEHNRAAGDSLRLVALDTRGDGVQAVLSARSLIEEEGCLALVGALLSPTTIAVATLCQERGVPLVSPTATQENISELGDTIFQTNSTRAFETRLVARTAVETLLRRRLAILYPATEEGRLSANLFAREVESLGARVVASEPYEPGTTDFREPIERLRQAGPEALYVPASAGEMRLLAPQLTFYRLEVQLLGPSTWSQPRVAREVGEDLDRAVFPSDTAQLPPGEEERFRRLWLRRFGEEETNPFGLKTYFATLQVLQAIQDGARTRATLQAQLARSLGPGSGPVAAGGAPGALRVMVDGAVKPFPWRIFATPPALPPAGEMEEAPASGAP